MIDDILKDKIASAINLIPLPCIENKCLVYPACKTHLTLTLCQDLEDYITDIINAIQQSDIRYTNITINSLFDDGYEDECNILVSCVRKYFNLPEI